MTFKERLNRYFGSDIPNKKKIKVNPKIDLDKLFLQEDKKQVYRTNNIQNIPYRIHRTGGKNSYAEWAHVIGIFQTLIYQQLEKKEANKILDIGCGSGLLSMAAQNFIEGDGFYLGIDINRKEIDFCKNYYTHPNFIFKHIDANNALYANNQLKTNVKWDINNNSIDLITALSVWTHLNENDALFYFKEIKRVLKKNGKAIITFFYLDDLYRKSLSVRKNIKGKYHSTSQLEWIFDKSAYESKEWFYPSILDVPEKAIGVTEGGIAMLLKESGLKLIEYYPGNWKEIPSVFFQDIIIIQKAI
ncbi:class I SAM-dependent methyltransferase [Aestuariivivens sediminis]|uniref:class I SAM-dependent methyltransferase n=1 Tax=Aestuariivivens sediminis TaxID=2913557 RepID=UPI001F5671A4|nr:class I SAM-dependent methyltransferase [Aestuariivivens sediminis]